MCVWRFDGGTRWSVAPPSRQAEAIEYTLSRSNRMLVEVHTSVFLSSGMKIRLTERRGITISVYDSHYTNFLVTIIAFFPYFT